MKRFLLKSVKCFHFLMVLLLTLCSFAVTEAQTAATSDEINAAIVNSPVPITFSNSEDSDSDIPFEIKEDSNGKYIQCKLKHGEQASISATFTIDRYSLFRSGSRYLQGSGAFSVYIDGYMYSAKGKFNTEVVLSPGKHTIQFHVRNNNVNDGYSSQNYLLSYIKIDQQWDEVRVDYPGDLTNKLYDLIENIGDRKLNLLKISGTISSEDLESLREYTTFTYINNKDNPMKEIYGIDLSNTDLKSIPEYCFSSYTNSNTNQKASFDYLSTVIFPETLESISPYAFYSRNDNGGNIFQIHIPSSVEKIEMYSFYESNLCSVTFDNDSRLKTIEKWAFSNSRLQDVKLSDSVTYIDKSAFFSCTLLSKIQLPTSLIEISKEAFASSGLKNVVIPQNVKHIGQSSFSDCSKLKKVTLNSHSNKLYDTFSGCTALDTLIIASATPPSIIATSDPFNNVSKDSVVLLVPDFAVESYKNNTYWSQFTGVQSSPELSESDFWAIHGYVSQSEDQKFSGSPSIEIESEGVLDVAENTTLALDEIIFSNEDSEPPCFLNESNNVTVNKLTTKFIVPSGGRWYFFSPATDVNMSDVTFEPNASWMICYYDGARRASENSSSGNWSNMPSNGTLKRGQGYVIQASSAGVLNMPAISTDYTAFLGTDDASMILSDNSCETLENMGWNLVANPYPAFYDSYQMDFDAPITVWTGSTYRAFSLLDDEFVLRPLQPFFVQKYDADLSFGMPREGRQSGYTISRSSIKHVKGIDNNRDCLNIEITRNDLDEAADYTRIVINKDASMAYEGNRDATKFMGMDSNVVQIYSLGENYIPMAINERPYADGNVALGVYLPKSGETYSLSAKRCDRRAWLYDAAEGTEHDLTEADYIFTSKNAGSDNSRFSIRFASADETAVNGIDDADVKVVGGNGILTVNAPSGAEIHVYAADGSLIANGMSENGSYELSAVPGVYVVKVNGKGYKSIVK